MEEKEKGSLNKRRRKRERREEKGNQKGALKVVDALAARRSLPERTPLGVHRTVDDDRWVVVTRGEAIPFICRVIKQIAQFYPRKYINLGPV